MKKIAFLIPIILLILLISTKCLKDTKEDRFLKIKQSRDSLTQSLHWRKLKCGLYLNKNGEIGLEDHREIGMEGEIPEKYYIVSFGFNEENRKLLNKIIDTTTFKQLNYTYYKDKNHIYRFYGMADGGQFYICNEVDYNTFEVLGDCYAKDKNNIYEARNGKIDSVDYQTFKTKKNLSGCVAKDKYGYIIWNKRATKDELTDEYIQKAIKELDK